MIVKNAGIVLVVAEFEYQIESVLYLDYFVPIICF